MAERLHIMSKVIKKRNRKIKEAVYDKNWDLVSYLLDQAFENSLRKDRKYGTISLNIPISSEGRSTELGDSIANSELNPLNQFLQKEENTRLIKALLALSELEQQIIVGRYLNEKSFTLLAQETGLSDKTVKKRLESATQQIKLALHEEK